MEFHMMNITYAALHMRAQTWKDKIYMQRWLYVDKAHTAVDIFCFGVFFFTQHNIKKQHNTRTKPRVGRWYSTLQKNKQSSLSILTLYRNFHEIQKATFSKTEN